MVARSANVRAPGSLTADSRPAATSIVTVWYYMAKKPRVPQASRKASPTATRKTSTSAARRRSSTASANHRPADAKRAEYAAALALYEKALGTLQKGKVTSAATLFQRLIDKYPDERELHERSHRYLEVCTRKNTPDPAPTTVEERVYAATLALNSGADEEAISHLQAALKKAPNSDHVQYMLAVAKATTGNVEEASSHLHRALELNPDNRFIARTEPTFDVLREDDALQQILGADPNPDAAGG